MIRKSAIGHEWFNIIFTIGVLGVSLTGDWESWDRKFPQPLISVIDYLQKVTSDAPFKQVNVALARFSKRCLRKSGKKGSLFCCKDA